MIGSVKVPIGDFIMRGDGIVAWRCGWLAECVGEGEGGEGDGLGVGVDWMWWGASV